MAKPSKHFTPAHFINRELSWLEFNHRVLEEVLDPATPLMERVKFFCIVSSNLDEFFEVRVAGVKQQIESDASERSVDGLTPVETFRAITRRVRRMVDQMYTCWREALVPALARQRIRFLPFDQLDETRRRWVADLYQTKIRPVLTPLGIDPAHPFPQLLNKSLNMLVQLDILQYGEVRTRLAVVQVPRNIPRLIRLPGDETTRDFIFLGHLVGQCLQDVFPGTTIRGFWLFRVTRNSELYIDEEEEKNSVLRAVEEELHKRRRGAAVRLELEPDCPLDLQTWLLENLGIREDDLYIVHGPLNPVRLMTLCEVDPSPELRDPPFLPPLAAAVLERSDLFAAIRDGDILLHHPYESFETVVEFLQQAARDPQVLAIKQTLYRTGGDRRIIGALMEAVRNGKQVTAVVELKARFDEANNIQWSRQLEDAGVHVVYGLVGYKIHSKLTLVVRNDDDGIRRYLHLATGNYNPTTARIYTDLGLLTCRPDFGEDATNLFNLLTGICQFQPTHKLLVAPFALHDRMLELIERETGQAQRGLPARIVAKMNSLVDRQIIEALYRASQAGVTIDLIVRGICCLRPGLKGISESITVRSVVDRFLEHSRIFYFENGCQPEVYVGSADWMPRNFFKRIEVVFPIEDGRLRERVVTEILGLTLQDNTKARFLRSDGTYWRPARRRGAAPRRSQMDLIRTALDAAARATSGPIPGAKPRTARMRLNPRPHTD